LDIGFLPTQSISFVINILRLIRGIYKALPEGEISQILKNTMGKTKLHKSGFTNLFLFQYYAETFRRQSWRSKGFAQRQHL
jgi:hypothetical protein